MIKINTKMIQKINIKKIIKKKNIKIKKNIKKEESIAHLAQVLLHFYPQIHVLAQILVDREAGAKKSIIAKKDIDFFIYI